MWLGVCFGELGAFQTVSVHGEVLAEVSSGLLGVGLSIGLHAKTFGCRSMT